MDRLGERDPDRRRGEPGLEGRLAVHHPAVEPVEVVEGLGPRERPSVRRRVLEEQEPARPLAPVDGRAVHEARMVDGDAPGGRSEGDRPRKVERGAREIDAAAERPVRIVVVVDRPAVAPGEHHHRAVPLVHVVEEDADREHVVIGVRVEGPVLVPLDGRAVARRLEVHLAARPHPDVAADEGLESGHHRRVAGHVPVEGMGEVGALDAPDARALRGMGGLEVEDLRVVGEAARARDHLVRNPPELAEGVRVEEPFDDDVALAPVVLDLFSRQHRPHPLPSRPRPRAGAGLVVPACWQPRRAPPSALRRPLPCRPPGGAIIISRGAIPTSGDGPAPATALAGTRASSR